MLLNKKSSSKRDSMQQSVDNAAKTLLANIRFMSVDKPIQAVVITSAIPNEGKTFVASNLARAMATSGAKTLVVECDMRRRSISHELHVHAQHGLYSVMSGDVALEDAALPTNTDGMFFLDAEPHIPNPSDLLNSKRFSKLIEQTRKAYDYVVFDTPPVGTFVDAAVLGAKVDAVFMVVREHFTRKDDIARAAEQLKTANVPLSGIVMNFCERSSGGYYYYDYYYREGGKGGDPDVTYAGPKLTVTNEAEDWSNAPDLDDGSNYGEGSTYGGSSNWSNAPDLGDGPSAGGTSGVASATDSAPIDMDDLDELDEPEKTGDLGAITDSGYILRGKYMQRSAQPAKKPSGSTGGQRFSRPRYSTEQDAGETMSIDRDELRRRL